MSGLLMFGIRFGTDRFKQLLAQVGNPHSQLRAAHIAGTNGKGSTTAMIASIMRSAGYKVGGYYSPYVFDVRERILVDGQPIPKEDFSRWVTLLKSHIEALEKTELGETTEFELKTAVAFCYFAEQQVEFASVEVGMGGRLDATNVITPRVSIITNVGLDHTERLGKTHAEIAYEKAGIIKPDVPVITAVANPEALQVVEQVAGERNAPLIKVMHREGSPPDHEVWWSFGKDPNTVVVRLNGVELQLAHPRLPGSYQGSNVACAVAAAFELRSSSDLSVPPEAIELGIRNAWLPGRFHLVSREPLVILDGAHNTDAAQALAEAIKLQYGSRRLTLILGMVQNHDPSGVIEALCPLADEIILTQPDNSRALPVEFLVEEANRQKFSFKVENSVSAAVAKAFEKASPEDVILITGSFYTIGDVSVAEIASQNGTYTGFVQ